MFCQFKDILGKPNTGSHSYRIFNIAIIDVLLTLLGAYLIIYFNPSYSFTSVTIGLFLLGIILHRLFCVRTTIDKLLFNQKFDNFIYKDSINIINEKNNSLHQTWSN